MRLSWSVGIWLSLLLLLGSTENFMHKMGVITRGAHASPEMLPADGDAWTENKNATYPWKCTTAYPDTIQFTTEKAYVESYSLKVNHTSATNRAYFYLDLGTLQNFSGYWGLIFWIRVERTDKKALYVEASDVAPAGAGNYFAVYIVPHVNAWSKVVFPLNISSKKSGFPVWTSIRYINIFTGEETLGLADKTVFYVDGMRFITAPEPPTIRNQVDDTALANLYATYPKFEKQVVYLNKVFTSLWDWVKVADGTPIGGEEGLALGQSIFALSYLYNLTGDTAFLAEAHSLANWYMNFQNSTHGNFYFHFDNATEQFFRVTNVYHTGWALAGFSFLYGVTQNAPYKTVADKARSWLIDRMYSSLPLGFYPSWNASSALGYGTPATSGMQASGGQLGLATYYKYVSQNATVKTVFEKIYSDVYLRNVGTRARHKLYWDTYQNTACMMWAFYMAYLGMANSTYWDNTLKLYPEILKANMLIYNNGSASNYMWLSDGSGFDFFHNWGLVMSLPIFYRVYKAYDSAALPFIEKVLIDWLIATKGSTWLFPFSTDALKVRSWIPTALFFYMALIEYYRDKITKPYAIATDKTLGSSTYTENKLTLTIDSPSGTTSTTKVYAGDKGKPTSVSGATSWSYDSSSKIVTITAYHNGQATVIVEWTPPYQLSVNIFKNDVPINSNITLFNENEAIVEAVDNVFSYGWLLQPGTYYVQASIFYTEHVYTSDQIRVMLTTHQQLGINFLFGNLTVSCLDFKSQSIKNCAIVFTREDEKRFFTTDSSGRITLEAFYGNWTIEAYWMGVPVGGINVSVNESEVKVNIQCNVGDVAVVVVNQYGNLIKANVTLLNNNYGLAFSDYLDGRKQNVTFTQIPLVNYNLTIKDDFGTKTYVLNTSQARQIRIEVLIVEETTVDNTLYIIGGMVIVTVVGAMGYLFLRKRTIRPHRSPPENKQWIQTCFRLDRHQSQNLTVDEQSE